MPVVSASEGAQSALREQRRARMLGAARGSQAWLALLWLALLWLALATGCNGPGLEPPWSDDDGASRATNASGGTIPPPSGTSTGMGTGDFGNPLGGAAAGSGAPAAGSGGSADGPTPTVPPATSAGAGAVQPPPAEGPGGQSDGGAGFDPGQSMTGGDGGDPLREADFVPGCETEAPSALFSVEACRYPLPDDPALDPASLQVGTFDSGTPTLLSRGQSALGCLFGSDYYVDASVTPAVIVLCSQLCSALPATAQVVAIDGCGAAP